VRVLIIDDEAMVARVTRKTLEKRGHEVLVATQPAEARQLWAEHAATLDLVICDIAMSQLRGPELIAQLAASGVMRPVLFITGYSDEAVHAELKHPVLSKPFTAAELLDAIQRALAMP
jgi:two-component system, cell cycle sensor histidine kinase and response regulator CckA